MELIADPVFQQSAQVHEATMEEMPRPLHNDQVGRRFRALDPGLHRVCGYDVILVALNHQPRTFRAWQITEIITIDRRCYRYELAQAEIGCCAQGNIGPE